MENIIIKQPRPNYVLIKPLPVEKDAVAGHDDEKILQRTQQDQMQAQKRQRHGTVVLMGRDCNDWIKVGDTVSFYRNAATDIQHDGEDHVMCHEDHVLAAI